MPIRQRPRLLLLAYELADPLFSGNGTYGRTVVEGLCSGLVDKLQRLELVSPPPSPFTLRASVEIDVITAVPRDPIAASSTDTTPPEEVEEEEVFPLPSSLQQKEGQQQRVTVRLLKVPVPVTSWRRHDWGSGWAQFAEGAARLYGTRIRSGLQLSSGLQSDEVEEEGNTINYDGVAVIDWHGLVALQQVLGGWDVLRDIAVTSNKTSDPGDRHGCRHHHHHGVRVVYLNFRVFGNPSLQGNGTDAEEEGSTFRLIEAMGLLCCSETVALCKADAVMLYDHAVQEMMRTTNTSATRDNKEEQVELSSQSSRLFDRAAIHAITEASLVRLQAPTTAPTTAPCSSSPPSAPLQVQVSVPLVVLPPVRSEVIASAKQMEDDIEGRCIDPSSCLPCSSPPSMSFIDQHLPAQLKAALLSSDNSTTSASTNLLERRLIVCCVRQARDKNPDRFVSLMEDLCTLLPKTHKDADDTDGPLLGSHNSFYIPVVFGASPEPSFSEELRQRLLTVCPNAVWLTGFVTPPQLVAIFRLAVLNVHPSLYDAYGLTVVEAAVCRCPTLLHKEEGSVSSPVGVVDLLMPSSPNNNNGLGESSSSSELLPSVFFADLRSEPQATRGNTARYVASLFDRGRCFAAASSLVSSSSTTATTTQLLISVAERACAIARQYDTAACGRRLAEIVIGKSCEPQ